MPQAITAAIAANPIILYLLSLINCGSSISINSGSARNIYFTVYIEDTVSKTQETVKRTAVSSVMRILMDKALNTSHLSLFCGAPGAVCPSRPPRPTLFNLQFTIYNVQCTILEARCACYLYNKIRAYALWLTTYDFRRKRVALENIKKSIRN